MTSYLVTPVGIGGRLRPDLAVRVVGWDLRLIEENVRLRRQLVVAQAAARHMEALRERMDNEATLRVRAQGWLDQVALGLAVIAVVHPEAARTVEVVREAIWRQGDA